MPKLINLIDQHSSNSHPLYIDADHYNYNSKHLYWRQYPRLAITIVGATLAPTDGPTR